MSSLEEATSRKRKRAERRAEEASSRRYHGRHGGKKAKLNGADGGKQGPGNVTRDQSKTAASANPESRAVETSNPGKPVENGQSIRQGEERKRKRTKDERGDRRKSSDGQPEVIEKPGSKEQKEETKALKPKKRKHKRGGTTSIQTTSDWEVSSPSGGRFIDYAPIFSRDEQYIMFATEFATEIYSTTTSLKLHSLTSNIDPTISCYTPSPTDSELLYVCASNGDILSWKWRTGERLGRWNINSFIFDAKITRFDHTSQDTIFTINHKEQWCLNAHRLGGKTSPEDTQVVNVLKYENPIISFELLQDGKTIVAITQESLLVGKLTETTSAELKDVRYSWREIKLATNPTCFAARMSGDLGFEPSNHKSQRRKRPVPSTLEVAVGTKNGCISLYRDLFKTLGIMNEPSRKVKTTTGVDAARLHWHRNAVGAVAWSKDGNYLISGGQETVLVLWQLDTGKQQFLPNLESPIESITVSPSGTSYGIRLGDNSVMVLSTRELVPTANVAGLQSSSTLGTENIAAIPQVAGVIHPHSDMELLLSVPSSINPDTYDVKTCSAPYLQTFDVSSSRHISRQALARTNATNTNQTPDGRKIREPDVTHVQISSDGKWLATADEWAPTPDDIRDVTLRGESVKAEIAKRQEVNLKFWSWNIDEKTWMLNSRFSLPHLDEDNQAFSRILDLAADSTSLRFATVGEDSVVRVWTAKTNSKRDEKSAQLHDLSEKGSNVMSSWWSCKHTVPLETAGSTADSLRRKAPNRAKLAFSNDGSILAVYQNFTDFPLGLIHFIDVARGSIRDSRTGFPVGRDGTYGMAFLERHLICVGREAISIWDVTTQAEKTRILLQTASHSPKLPPPLLAINVPSNTFAVTYSLKQESERDRQRAPPRCRLQIYSLTPQNTGELAFDQTLPRSATALISAGGIRGQRDPAFSKASNSRYGDVSADLKAYMILDAGAAVRTVKLGDKSRLKRLRDQHKALKREDAASRKSAAEEEEEGSGYKIPEASSDSSNIDEAEARPGLEDFRSEHDPPDPVVVQPERLARLFDYPSHAMPGVKQLWESVQSLYAPPANRATSEKDEGHDDEVDHMAMAFDGTGQESDSDSFDSDSD